MRRIIRYMSAALCAVMLCCAGAQAAWQEDYPWAVDGVTYCLDKGIMEGMGGGDLNLGGSLTKAQMAKLLSEAFGLNDEGVFSDKLAEHWSYDYVNRFQKCIVKKDEFEPDADVTREEFAAGLVLASGLNENSIRNYDILTDNFEDAGKVDSAYNKYLCIAVERGYMYGADKLLRPKDKLRRAEAAVFIYRVIGIKAGTITAELGIEKTYTPLVGEAQISCEAAQEWAKASGAHERFIEIAPIYWKYGELTGLRPEILYAQAAKETGFGKYGGRVLPEMNNWAGIKTAAAAGDATEDHETFETPDDGVRAHFNHMCAYVGLEPIGEPHGRYYVVKSIAWAGTVKYAEELGGRWCPDLYYGYAILKKLVAPMMKYNV